MSTSATDLAATITSQVLDAVTQAQELALDAVRSAVEVIAPVVSTLPEAPFADQLPKPQELVDAGFALAGQLLNRQRTFTLELAGILGGLRSEAAAESTN